MKKFTIISLKTYNYLEVLSETKMEIFLNFRLLWEVDLGNRHLKNFNLEADLRFVRYDDNYWESIMYRNTI